MLQNSNYENKTIYIDVIQIFLPYRCSSEKDKMNGTY